MAELTERQLRLAAATLHARFAQENDPMGADLHVCMRGLESAAPFLQFLWQEPTREELDRFRTESIADFRNELQEFVRRRNASISCMASDLCSDPRHLAVRNLLVEFAGVAGEPGCPPSSGDYAEYAEKILAALDEVK